MFRRLLIKLTVLGLALGTALVLAEGLLQLLNPWIGRHTDTMFRVIEFDPELGWKMPANIQSLVSFVDVEDIPIRSNRWGFWDGDWAEAKTPGRCRIACMGDSFTWGLGVEEAERFSNQLSTLDPRYETMNLGMPGFGTDQSLVAWRSIGAHFQPDVVILTIYQNDFGDNHYEVSNGRSKPYFALEAGELKLENEPVPDIDFWDTGVMLQVAPPYRHLYPVWTSRRNRVVQWLAKNSDLVRMIYTMSRAATQAQARADESSKPPRTSPPPAAELGPLEHAQVQLMTNLVTALSREVEAAGGQLVVVLAGGEIPQFSAERTDLQAASIAFLDATTSALEARIGGRAVYFPYNRHWTPAAHQEVARMLDAWIAGEEACGSQAEAKP